MRRRTKLARRRPPRTFRFRSARAVPPVRALRPPQSRGPCHKRSEADPSQHCSRPFEVLYQISYISHNPCAPLSFAAASAADEEELLRLVANGLLCDTGAQRNDRISRTWESLAAGAARSSHYPLAVNMYVHAIRDWKKKTEKKSPPERGREATTSDYRRLAVSHQDSCAKNFLKNWSRHRCCSHGNDQIPTA